MSELRSPFLAHNHVASALAHLTAAMEQLHKAETQYSADGVDWATNLCDSSKAVILRVRDDVWARTAARWSMKDLRHDQ